VLKAIDVQQRVVRSS